MTLTLSIIKSLIGGGSCLIGRNWALRSIYAAEIGINLQNSLHLHVLIPVSNARLVRVFGATGQLLSCVLHLTSLISYIIIVSISFI